MKRKWKIIICIALALVSLQFIRPKETTGSAYGEAKQLGGVPREVNGILQTACFDCHSNETRLHWYDKITPVNFLVASHIRNGRKALDFSNWDSLATAQQSATLYYALNKILSGEMPLPSYTAIHPQAKISENGVETLKRYLLSISYDAKQGKAPSNNPKEITAVGVKPEREVKPSPNGIAYIPEYRNWKAISTTDRFDNGTVRIIFANETAVKALQSKKTDPWPDGSIFAKTAWKQQQNADGSISAGKFVQVEFMIKDARKYAKTKGWGWGRWKGDDLLPYGKTLDFDTECVSCHQPQRDNDYVFTRPIDLFNFKN
jgi:hypothetical protein